MDNDGMWDTVVGVAIDLMTEEGASKSKVERRRILATRLYPFWHNYSWKSSRATAILCNNHVISLDTQLRATETKDP